MRFNMARNGKGALALCLLVGLAACLCPQTIATTSRQEIQFLPSDRILVLAPHPDDESIACAGVIQQAIKRDIPVRVFS